MVQVTRNPWRAYRATRLGRAATHNGAMQKLSEIAPFRAVVGHPRTVIEIGAGKGGMLAALCSVATDDATIISIDLEGGPFGGGVSDAELRARANARPGQTLHLVRGDSQDYELSQRVAGLVRDGVDLLLIDGDHTYDGVRRDFCLHSQLVAPGEIIALHDILPHSSVPECQVDRFWRELSSTRKWEIVSPRELYEGGTWGGIGIIEAPIDG